MNTQKTWRAGVRARHVIEVGSDFWRAGTPALRDVLFILLSALAVMSCRAGYA